MPTTAELFGLTPQEHAAAVFTSLGEAGPGDDLAGVYSVLVNRKIRGGYGKNIVNIASAPQQFVANTGKTAAQISDPNFGRKKYGSRYDQAYAALNDPNKLAPIFNQLKGATSFRGQALLQNKQKSDVMLNPKGNFYFDYNPAVHQKGLKILSSTGSETSSTAQPEGKNTFIVLADQESTPKSFLEDYASNLIAAGAPKIQTGLDPVSLLTRVALQTPNYLEGEA